MVKVALYARVSKEEEGIQNPENQLAPMREFCVSRGWEYVEYVEYKSGGSDRPIFRQLLVDAMMRKFDGIVIWSLDRFSREGISNTLSYITRLRERGVFLISLREEWLNTSKENPFAELMMAMFAFFAAFERKRLSERTKAALARRKALGVRLGRPPRCPKCGRSHKSLQCPPVDISGISLQGVTVKKPDIPPRMNVL